MLVLAARDGLIDKVPYIELFEEHNLRERVATETEFKAIYDAADEHLQELLACIWDSGMRKREATYLTWDRVDLKSDMITLGNGDTKTGEGRLIPISPRLKQVFLKIWQRERGVESINRRRARKVSEGENQTNRVFLFRGREIDRFDHAYKNACEKAGVEGLWIHDLRATFATRKIDEGFDRDWVKMITGHKTDHVFKRYNRPSPEKLRKVVSGDKILHEQYTSKPAETAVAS